MSRQSQHFVTLTSRLLMRNVNKNLQCRCNTFGMSQRIPISSLNIQRFFASSSKDPKVPEDHQTQGSNGSNMPQNMQEHAGRQHEFYAHRATDIMDQHDYNQGNIGSPLSLSSASYTVASGTGPSQNDIDHAEAYTHTGQVSLHSVMQSQVPEPFNAHGRNPTHMNMPSGGVKMGDKFVAGQRNDAHQSHNYQGTKKFHSYTALQGLQKADTNPIDNTSIQGVQGEDSAQFAEWIGNCHQFHLGDCESQLKEVSKGSKTLAVIFAEQEQLIRRIADDYKKGVSGEGVLEGYPQVSVSSLQGIQGSDSPCFDVWLKNCNSYGFNNCKDELDHVRAGRKSLDQIFKDQEKLIQEIADKFSQIKQAEDVSASPPQGAATVQLSAKQKMQRAVKEYGATVVVFHVAISLVSLGGFYTAVSSGIDMVGLLQRAGVGQALLESKLATGASTFVVAYAVHKVFAPVRIGITLTSTPIIVRYLRQKGILKPPKAVR